MIVALLFVSGDVRRVVSYLPAGLRPWVSWLFPGNPPTGLGKRFEQS
jgi:hypothetical protein